MNRAIGQYEGGSDHQRCKRIERGSSDGATTPGADSNKAAPIAQSAITGTPPRHIAQEVVWAAHPLPGISQMTPKIREIAPLFHRQENCIPSAAIRKVETETLSNDGAMWVTLPWKPSYLGYIGSWALAPWMSRGVQFAHWDLARIVGEEDQWDA